MSGTWLLCGQSIELDEMLLVDNRLDGDREGGNLHRGSRFNFVASKLQ